MFKLTDLETTRSVNLTVSELIDDFSTRFQPDEYDMSNAEFSKLVATLTTKNLSLQAILMLLRKQYQKMGEQLDLL